MERFIRQHNDAVRQMLFPLHSNMERFILILPVHRQAVPAPFTSQYGEIHTAVLPPFYAQIHLRRCCLCYNCAFDFQFFRKNQIFVCRSTGQYGEIHTAVLPPFYAQIHLRRCCLCYNCAFDFQFFRKNQIFVCRSTGFLALLDIDRHHYMTVFSRKCLCQKGCILKGLLTHLLSLLHTL